MTTKAEVKAWAIYTPKGKINAHFIGYTKNQVVGDFCNFYSCTIKEMKKYGWKCKKVLITEIKE